MSALWDGLVGAVIGGILTATATFLTVRWQTIRLLNDERVRAKEARDDEHRDWLRRREEQALGNLLAALNELQVKVPTLYALPAKGVSNYRLNPAAGEDRANAEYAYETLLHGLRVDLPLVMDAEVRRRYQALVPLVEELAKLGLGRSADDRERWRSNVVRYIGYVRHTVKNALHGISLPAATDPPVLAGRDRGLWTAIETDPEDAYFPEPTRTASSDPTDKAP